MGIFFQYYKFRKTFIRKMGVAIIVGAVSVVASLLLCLSRVPFLSPKCYSLLYVSAPCSTGLPEMIMSP